jgi:hypothetical protein
MQKQADCPRPEDLARRITDKGIFRWLLQYGVILVDPVKGSSL